MMIASQSGEQEVPVSSGTPANSSINIDYHALKKAALVLRALNHKLRQQLLKLIEDEKRITVTEIYVRLRLEQSVASQHLAILRKAGIVSTEREGKFIYYMVNYKRLDEISLFVKNLVG
ncbi:MAG TPA: metalloregulator ArsR/SmtB family transcription factor [Ferruginibacter sp.]|mgnify:FL=1|nr:helix-turn-helix transcriptional regulator [Ferruginibacter sp.]MBN8698287.1 helix-turn-helix transcriptional regulator [Chitinophagales bacterium]HMX79903.1 metalloregulator ArsR/SmtB family transcription factor [Ferruginibacter sp.]HMZ99850.1 metalloregulator ArsR/SmtB family transcription factor [Ferruginibacter sp.]HNJ30115.1 metalloregulator ArsR/SmtB family transcription factor [Ferruginibacter sp.]